MLLTPAGKVFLPIAAVAFVSAIVYSGLTGDQAGVVLLLTLAVVSAFAAGAVSSERRAEVAVAVPADAGPPQWRPTGPPPAPSGGTWPFVGAVGAGLLVASPMVTPWLAVGGGALALAAVVGWMASVSGEHTGRPVNLLPIGLPVVGLFCIGSLMFFMSRVLLAVPESASTAVALAVAVVILAGASLAALRPAVSSRAVIVGLAIGGLLMVGGGVVAAAVGPRTEEKPEAARTEGVVQVVAKGTAFAEKEIMLKASSPAEIRFNNKDGGIPHNVAIYARPDAPANDSLFTGEVVVGPAKADYRFTAPPPGTYAFRCDVHISMQGTVVVT